MRLNCLKTSDRLTLFSLLIPFRFSILSDRSSDPLLVSSSFISSAQIFPSQRICCVCFTNTCAVWPSNTQPQMQCCLVYFESPSLLLRNRKYWSDNSSNYSDHLSLRKLGVFLAVIITCAFSYLAEITPLPPKLQFTGCLVVRLLALTSWHAGTQTWWLHGQISNPTGLNGLLKLGIRGATKPGDCQHLAPWTQGTQMGTQHNNNA